MQLKAKEKLLTSDKFRVAEHMPELITGRHWDYTRDSATSSEGFEPNLEHIEFSVL